MGRVPVLKEHAGPRFSSLSPTSDVRPRANAAVHGHGTCALVHRLSRQSSESCCARHVLRGFRVRHLAKEVVVRTTVWFKLLVVPSVAARAASTTLGLAARADAPKASILRSEGRGGFGFFKRCVQIVMYLKFLDSFATLQRERGGRNDRRQYWGGPHTVCHEVLG